MANKKDTYYFSHDSNARNDEKILMLRAEHGWQGYGLYWALVEMMFEANDTSLYHDKIKGLALSYNVDITLLQGVINTAINEGLFKSDNKRFWSESLVRRKAAFHELREQKSLAGKKGMASRWGSDNTVITDNNTVITKHNKVKESKVKESKVKDIGTPARKQPKKEILTLGSQGNVKLTQEELDKLSLEYPDLINEALEFLSMYIADKGYKTKSQTHNLAIRRWVIKAVKERKQQNKGSHKKTTVGNFEGRGVDYYEKIAQENGGII